MRVRQSPFARNRQLGRLRGLGSMTINGVLQNAAGDTFPVTGITVDSVAAYAAVLAQNGLQLVSWVDVSDPATEYVQTPPTPIETANPIVTIQPVSTSLVPIAVSSSPNDVMLPDPSLPPAAVYVQPAANDPSYPVTTAVPAAGMSTGELVLGGAAVVGLLWWLGRKR